jgi:long-chain acyl-CoA synthetase
MRDHLATLLDDFRRYDRQIAVVRFQGNRRRATTYGELAGLAGRFAALLAQREIGSGDRVLLWGENSAEWIAAFHGCLLRGVLAVPLDAYGSAEFAQRVAADVRPKLAVGDALMLHQLPSEWPRLSFDDWLSALPAEEAGPIAGLSRQTPLQILFTSGTTGDPKGVVLTHGNVLASIEPIEKGAQPYMRWELLLAHPLRIFDTLPLSHVFGQTMGLWVPPIFTAQVHFESRLVAGRLVETIKRERISVLAAVPRVMALLKTHLEASHPGLTERIAASTGIRAWKRWWRFRDVHSAFGLKFWAVISGGGALPGPLEQFWNALGLVVVQGYGMTETSALITLNHPFHVAHGTIGKPMPGREVKLGPDGEVLVRGESISAASWSGGAMRPRADEWLATGDLAESVAGGELRFLGRKSEVIVTAAGMNLHPEDLEAAIEQEPGVTACAVVAMETVSGPEPCAVLAMRGHGDVSAVAPLDFVAGAGPAANLDRQGQAQGSLGVAGRNSDCCRGVLHQRGCHSRCLWCLVGLAACADRRNLRRSPARRRRRAAAERRSAPRQPGPGATGGGSGRAAGDCAAGRAAGRGAHVGRTAQTGSRRGQGHAECVDSQPCDRRKSQGWGTEP